MRRRLLLAALLCAPSVAHADDLYLFTPWYGCTSGGTCFTATGYTPIDPRQGPTALVTYLTCTPSCTPVNLMWELTFYDEHDQIIEGWHNSGDINFAPPSTASYGVLDTYWFPNDANGMPNALDSRHSTGVKMYTTPEPTTFILLGTGVLIVMGLGRRFL